MRYYLFHVHGQAVSYAGDNLDVIQANKWLDKDVYLIDGPHLKGFLKMVTELPSKAARFTFKTSNRTFGYVGEYDYVSVLKSRLKRAGQTDQIILSTAAVRSWEL